MPVNNYKPPAPSTRKEKDFMSTPAEDYDLNFLWEVPLLLETSGGVSLSPFIPTVHAESFYSSVSSTPNVWSYFPSTITDFHSFVLWLERWRKDSSATLFAIHDLSRPSHPLAGVIGVLNSSAANRCTELGAIVVIPEFQRTHVLSHAAGLLLRWSFETLKLRRVVWQANAANEASIRAAKRLGFRWEGLIRWQRVLPVDKGEKDGGVLLPEWAKEEEEKEGRGLGRHSAHFAVCWDEWEEGGKELIAGLISREVKSREN